MVYRPMRFALLLVLASSSLASADAIQPLIGECAIGSETGVRNHAEVCIPINCTQTNACPTGSHCVELCTCWAEREHYGRMPEPRMIDTEIGRCNASGACDEGRVVQRKECQPDEAVTPTMDPATMSAEPEPTMDPEPNMQPTMEPTEPTTTAEEESGGCSAAGAIPGFSLAALLLFVRTRRR